MAASSQVDDAIYTAAAVGLRGDSSVRTVLPTDSGIALLRARLARFLQEIDPDLTARDLLDELAASDEGRS